MATNNYDKMKQRDILTKVATDMDWVIKALDRQENHVNNQIARCNDRFKSIENKSTRKATGYATIIGSIIIGILEAIRRFMG